MAATATATAKHNLAKIYKFHVGVTHMNAFSFHMREARLNALRHQTRFVLFSSSLLWLMIIIIIRLANANRVQRAVQLVTGWRNFEFRRNTVVKVLTDSVDPNRLSSSTTNRIARIFSIKIPCSEWAPTGCNLPSWHSCTILPKMGFNKKFKLL